MYTITQIEDAIIAELKAAAGLTALCPADRITPYHGEIDLLVKQIEQLTIALPAIYGIYGGSGYVEDANRSYSEEFNYSVVCVAKDLRGNEKLKAAIYPILEEMKSALIDNNLDLNIEPLHPVRIDPTLITRFFSIYSFDIKTSFSL